ncbi:filamentous hemagglutinin family protein [Methylosinus sp. sav-2]|uniref:two-partner secretion domain-containing protein n=1 Tax=Methylosinus sp. sav-2 TaxID=2485168 RepID=UPI00047C3062|nr:filamentous hemagglutinin N-terminal domain-containing protein [Methylosinus sp. sav-2]TDX61815.1 filamentous hemagglutinin family protein [Methylosinus sp. sav-2]
MRFSRNVGRKTESWAAVSTSISSQRHRADLLALRGAFSTMTAIAAVLALPRFALANPTGGVVVDGAATIASAGSVTNITQATNRAIINWQGFSIGAGETVNFLQPTATSVTLNRVVGNEQSVISGALNANGRVFLVNSAGILFGKDAQVNVGGLVASTLDISNSNFMAGNYVFSGSSNAAVVNQGKIKASEGGYVALLGKTVSNEGTITAKLGTIALASGEQITLNFGGDSLVDVTIDKGTYDALVQNKGLIKANGGQVVLTAKAADDLLSAQVNNSGIIKARTLADLTGGSSSSGGSVKVGRIKLLASGGTVNVSGKLDASARKGGDGGTIETSGNKVTVADSAVVTTASTSGATGSWIIDPDGFTIGIGGDITGAALTSQLASNNVTIQSTSGHGADGNIYVNDAVSWSGNRLTLTATNNVFIDAVMTATGTASFAANYGVGTNADGTPKGLYAYQGATNGVFAGRLDFSSAGTFTLNGANYTVITTVAGLDAVKNDLAGNYVLGADLSGLRARNWSGPIGATTAFTGNFNGLGHSVISAQLTGSGLFGTIGAGGLVSNFAVASASLSAGTTSSAAAGLLANVNQGSIVNSFSSGNVVPRAAANPTVTIDSVGGLVGVNSGLIAQSYSLANVAITSVGGGLVGTNEASGRIIDSSARALNLSTNTQLLTNTAFGVSNLSYVGGLVGVNAGKIDRSYAGNQIRLSSADTTSIAGGFVGKNTGTIDQSYSYMEYAATGNFYSAGPRLAGFVGQNTGTITNAYTTSLNGTNASSNWSAAFAYQNSGTISNAYATSYSVGGAQPQYGFVADNTGGAITNAYWYSSGSPVTDSSAAKSLTAAEAPSFASYAGFDAAIWAASKSGYPILANLLIYVSTSTIPTYGVATSTISTLSLSVLGLQGGGGSGFSKDDVSSTTLNPFTVATSNGYVDAGMQAASSVLSSVYKNVKGTVTVNPKALTISGVVADKVYDGTTSATLNSGVANSGLIGLIGDQTLNVAYTSAAFADKNAAVGKTVNLAYTAADGANGGKASNYTIANTTTATIGPKPISAAATGVDKVYDGATVDAISYQLPGKVAGDNLSLSYSMAQFADKNVGQSKAVAVSGLALTGTDSDNYILQNASLTTTANITPLALSLYGTKSADGSVSIGAGNLAAMNVVAGDSVSLGGSAKIAGSAAGVQSITDVTALTVNNPNYTVVGSVGSVVVGNQSLALDHVASGAATIATSGNTTTITQTTNSAIIDWFRFSIAAGETVNFVQPSVTSVVLNRVTGNEKSVIAGALNANGRVFILNSAGVLFTAGSSVNVGALVASTLSISDANFNAGNYLFVASSGSGSVVAAGDIVIVDGGFAALASNNGVDQSGTLTARGGKVLLASANTLSLTLSTAASGLSSYIVGNLAGKTNVNGAVNVAAASGNGGLLETAGGSVVTGNSFALNTGVNGSWSWSQPDIIVGAGGTFSGQFVNGNLATRNFALNAIGGSVTLNDAVSWSSNNSLTLSATNNINVNAPVATTADRGALTLNAGADIYINDAVSLSGAHGALAMSYGGDYHIRSKASYAGATLDANGSPIAVKDTSGGVYGSISLPGDTATLAINGQSYTLIHSMDQLAALDDATGTASGKFALATNLDASQWSAAHLGAASVVSAISGTFAGLGHSIGNLTLKAPSTSSDPMGLIGRAGADGSASTIRDVGIVNVDISSASSSSGGGALLGTGNLVTLAQVYSTGSIAIAGGGLAGGVTGSNVTYAYSDAKVSGGGGGLLGSAGSYFNTGSTISHSHATGDVDKGGGGLVGGATATTIDYSYATGNVNGNDAGSGNGGLIGYATTIGTNSLKVTNSFATGNVRGGYNIGGLIGQISGSAQSAGGDVIIDNTYATGNVTSNFPDDAPLINGTGGLIGMVSTTGAGVGILITNSYATGDVTGTGAKNTGESIGGLVGYISTGARGGVSTIANSYATGNVSTTAGWYAGGLLGSSQSTKAVNIDKSYATGDVTGGTIATGGLAGTSAGAITNSYATGNVTTSGIQAGGLVGFNSGNITGSSASGAVTGTGASTWTGGLAGRNTGAIADSYSQGLVRGPEGLTGGISGVSYSSGSSAGSITNSFYDSESNPGLAMTNTPDGRSAGAVTGGGGLTNAQIKDVPYYINGTIGKVLADRAAAAAQLAQTRQAATSAGNVVSREARASSSNGAEASRATAGRAAVAAAASADIDDNMQGGEASQTPLPAPRMRASHVAATSSRAAHKVHASSPGAGYRARIRSIEVDGQHFDLGTDGKNNASEPKAR